ncbi:hypothetical protein D9Q98_003145 [Chlorella vulgaris]|uniref:Uncharacterized protein n=1 Tax=Chlorella vulgaris TaxID=3077 RepID=A0A9D4TS68_CHLVU|nr:hypothetical protein D9Q98_003145 [Chlorella vulgaris]
MNSDAVKATAAREEEMQRLGGLGAYRLQALQNLKLKTVVKESHASSVHALVMNQAEPTCANLFATVGKDQATVYDGEHMGEHVGVVVHFTNTASEHAPGGELQAAAWLSAEGWSQHPAGDACLAVAGADPNISVISVVEARVVRLLCGHKREVLELAAVPAAPRLLLSLSRDGNLRLWDVPSETCLSSIHTDATCIAFTADAASIATGNSKGRLHMYAISAAGRAAEAAAEPAADSAAAGAAAATGTTAATVAPVHHVCIDEGSRRELKCQGSNHSDALDCLRFLPGGRLVSKACDGRMFVWRISGGTNLEVAATWKVPNCSGGSWQNRCQFGCTVDGCYIAVGNSKGDCFVYDAASGDRVVHVSAIRVSAPVRACGLSHDCRHLLAVLGKGFIFRFEYLGALAPQAYAALQGGAASQEGKENSNSEQQVTQA